jgi:hypothetical protein
MATGGTIKVDVEVSGYWQRCPICGGRGFVAHGFYAVPMGYAYGTTSTAPDRCRRCVGTGTIETPAIASERTRP